jgi:hypothetical protein
MYAVDVLLCFCPGELKLVLLACTCVAAVARLCVVQWSLRALEACHQHIPALLRRQARLHATSLHLCCTVQICMPGPLLGLSALRAPA